MNKETNLEAFVHYLNNEIIQFVYDTMNSIKKGEDFVVEHADGKIVVSFETNYDFPTQSFFYVYNKTNPNEVSPNGVIFGKSHISEDRLKEFLVEVKIKNIIKK